MTSLSIIMKISRISEIERIISLHQFRTMSQKCIGRWFVAQLISWGVPYMLVRDNPIKSLKRVIKWISRTYFDIYICGDDKDKYAQD